MFQRFRVTYTLFPGGGERMSSWLLSSWLSSSSPSVTIGCVEGSPEIGILITTNFPRLWLGETAGGKLEERQFTPNGVLQLGEFKLVVPVSSNCESLSWAPSPAERDTHPPSVLSMVQQFPGIFRRSTRPMSKRGESANVLSPVPVLQFQVCKYCTSIKFIKHARNNHHIHTDLINYDMEFDKISRNPESAVTFLRVRGKRREVMPRKLDVSALMK